MSFYTALTGLNGSQADIAATSNNIANVGTTGFKRSRAEFGDIFATSPLQNASSSIGSGSILKGVKQQFTQGNIASSLNALDLAISGQGFFALKPSLTSGQVVYTRNGSFNVDNNRNVVDSTGQFLLTYPVNDDGSVTSKSISDAVPLQLPVTSGDPKATGNISLGVNLPADAPVVTENPKFADGYQFSTNDPESFTNSTSLTIFDDLGNPTIATVYFIKTQAATASDPTNKYETRLVIDETVIDPDLVASVNDNGQQVYIDRFGRETTIDNIADDNYFAEGKGSALYRRDDLNQVIPSQPASLTGSQSSFDFGEEGNKLIEITNDPMRFKATREAGNNDASIFWGKDFLLVNVDDGDVPVSVDLRPGFYNAIQLANEVERAINDAYGDDNKLQIRSNVDDTLTVDFSILNTSDGTLKGLAQPVEIDLLQPSYVSEQLGIDTTGSSPDFKREEFLAHAQVRIIDAMNAYEANTATGGALGVNNQLFTRSSGSQMSGPYENTDVVSFKYKSMATDGSATTEQQKHLVYSFYDKNPTLEVFDNKTAVKNGGNITYDAPNNILTVDLDPSSADMSAYTSGEVIRLAGSFDSYDSLLNGRSLTILEVDEANSQVKISTTGEGFPDASFQLQAIDNSDPLTFAKAYILSNPSSDVEAFFEGDHLTPAGAVNSYNNKKIVLRETSSATHSYNHNDTDFESADVDDVTWSTSKEYYITSVGNTDWTKASTSGGAGTMTALASAAEGTIFTPASTEALTGTGRIKEVKDNLTLVADQKYLVVEVGSNKTADVDRDGTAETITKGDYLVLNKPAATAVLPSASSPANGVAVTASDNTLTVTSIGSTGNIDVTVDGTTFTINIGNKTTTALTAAEIATKLNASTPFATKFSATASGSDITLAPAARQLPSGMKVIEISETFSDITSEALAGTSSLSDLGLAGAKFQNDTVWVDEKNPPVKISYDAVNQRFEFGVNHTAIGPGTDSNFRAFKIYGAGDADGTNNIGIPAPDAAASTAISSTAKVSADPFVADGGELQINAKRFGVKVDYNSDIKTFTFSSGTTGEDIPADGAIGVDEDQKASNIQVGRYALDASNGGVVNASFDTATRYMGAGDNGLMGVGASKNDVSFKAARGLASEPARAVGASATEPLSEVFALSATAGDNVFNVSVNGISGIIEVPGGNYVGSTLAEALQTRINQISDAVTGEVVGGVSVKYQADSNNFVFTTGTTGSDSTIKVKGAAKLGLDDVPLGVGSVPEIVNLVQATNEAGVPLFVNELGQVVETPPDNLVEDYFPLYIDEGELTFDKTGQIISPLNTVHYEQQAAGFSISLDVDYSASTQLSQPFSVNNLDQDGFTSGRLDGLDIDSTGLLRANYTNGENKPLGKIVLANFNNQNGLKQIGNATFVETATSGTPTFGEAGAEGFGAIQSGSLERSNVDITEELVNLITAQRNFQASSKAIETSTQLTQAIINIRS